MGEVKGVACCDRCGVSLPGVPEGQGIRVFCPECGRSRTTEVGSAASQGPVLPGILRAAAVLNFLAAGVGILTYEIWGPWVFLWAAAFAQAGLFWLAMAALVESARGRNSRK